MKKDEVLVSIKPLGKPTGIIFYPGIYEITHAAYMKRLNRELRKEKLKKIFIHHKRLEK
jgi:hypothetical protein